MAKDTRTRLVAIAHNRLHNVWLARWEFLVVLVVEIAASVLHLPMLLRSVLLLIGHALVVAWLGGP